MSHGWAAATVANENCALSSAPRLAIWRPAPDLAPFVSGYHLVEPKPERYDLHAWAEVYLQGAGWRVTDEAPCGVSRP